MSPLGKNFSSTHMKERKQKKEGGKKGREKEKKCAGLAAPGTRRASGPMGLSTVKGTLCLEAVIEGDLQGTLDIRAGLGAWSGQANVAQGKHW